MTSPKIEEQKTRRGLEQLGGIVLHGLGFQARGLFDDG